MKYRLAKKKLKRSVLVNQWTDLLMRSSMNCYKIFQLNNRTRLDDLRMVLNDHYYKYEYDQIMNLIHKSRISKSQYFHYITNRFYGFFVRSKKGLS